jgi:transcription initiation factor TFIIIB Brf1 subunit/transcription initiation factor TFIIB
VVKKVELACKELGLTESQTTFCSIAAENISKLSILAGKKPATVAGASIWMILRKFKVRGKDISLEDIAEKVGMGPHAIMNSFSLIEPYQNQIIPPQF